MQASTLLASLRTLFVMTLLLGFAYPLAVAGVAQLAFARAAAGSLVERDHTIVGSRLIGQSFEAPAWFQGRPSATSPGAYDPAGSAGSNLGPLNPALLDAVRARAMALRAANPEQRRPVPVELVSASGSGLDPEIGPSAALWQVPRVARARGLQPARVAALVRAHVRAPLWGYIGEARVNVLELNLALAALR